MALTFGVIGVVTSIMQQGTMAQLQKDLGGASSQGGSGAG